VTLNLISNAINHPGRPGDPERYVADNRCWSPSAIPALAFRRRARYHLSRIHRSERSIQSGYGGPGAGLAITKQLVEQHGGKIGARSPGDFGRRFDLLLQPAGCPGCANTDGYLCLPAGLWIFRGRADRTPLTRRTLVRLPARARFRAAHLSRRRTGGMVSDVLASPPAALIIGEPPGGPRRLGHPRNAKRQPSTEHIPVLAYSLDEQHDQGDCWI